ncbi:MAG: polyhydroxyalkanoic acid system family protein [Tepidisphaeraceae bacterium]
MSKTITITIPHKLSQDEARTRLQTGLVELKGKYGEKVANMQEHWDGNQMNFRLSAMGQAITGRVEVQAQAVKLDVDLPWMLALLAGKFKAQVEQEGRKMLE